MNILAIETSCDETAAAVVTDAGEILSNVVASQIADHAAFGGVVPEIASRRHIELISPVVTEAVLRSRRAPCLSGHCLWGSLSAKPLPMV